LVRFIYKGKEETKEQVLKEQACLLRHEGRGYAKKKKKKKTAFFLPCVLTKTSKFFISHISDSSCWEVDTPATEVTESRLRSNMVGARSCGQVHP